jgi:transcriptional regulator with XRE-family HTH domain
MDTYKTDTNNTAEDDLTKLLVQCRTERNLTLAQVAKIAKISTVALSNIERGIAKPRRTTRLRLVTFLQRHGYFAKEVAA